LGEDGLRQRIAGGVLRQRVVGVDERGLAVLPSIATSNRSGRFRVPAAHAIPCVQIGPAWFGCGLTCVWTKVAPASVLWAR